MSSPAPRLLLATGASLGGAFILGIAVIGGAISGSTSSSALTSLDLTSEACAVSGPVAGLSPTEAQNAEVIVSTAFADSGENMLAARISLMVADTESSLQNLGPIPGNDGSLGLFQQRVSQGWGTASEEMDAAEATSMFVDRLLMVNRWQWIQPWQAAQDVQRSAFSDASNYRAHWPAATRLITVILTNGNVAGGCGQGTGGGLAGSPAAHGLPDAYSIPAGTSPAHALVVEYALAQLGKQYVWGASGPSAFDCSGLTMQAWAVAGVRLEHYTVDQFREGSLVDPAFASPGDLVLVPGSDAPGPGLPGHVGIYLGDGLVLSAIDPQFGVAVQTWQTFVAGGLDGVVDPAPGR
jgi:cell wall-associated NlpC family hydrolase